MCLFIDSEMKMVSDTVFRSRDAGETTLSSSQINVTRVEQRALKPFSLALQATLVGLSVFLGVILSK